MDGNGQLVVALVGVSLLILAARGTLADAWSTLLGTGSAPSAAGEGGSATYATYPCYVAQNFAGCKSEADCKAAGGIAGLVAPAGHHCGNSTQSLSSPGPGAPGSGVTTQ